MKNTERPDYAAISLAALLARLPKHEWLLVSEVASATNQTSRSIYAHIESGNLHAMNFGVNESRPFFKIYRPSVVDFYKRRLGLAVEPGK